MSAGGVEVAGVTVAVSAGVCVLIGVTAAFSGFVATAVGATLTPPGATTVSPSSGTNGSLAGRCRKASTTFFETVGAVVTGVVTAVAAVASVGVAAASAAVAVCADAASWPAAVWLAAPTWSVTSPVGWSSAVAAAVSADAVEAGPRCMRRGSSKARTATSITSSTPSRMIRFRAAAAAGSDFVGAHDLVDRAHYEVPSAVVEAGGSEPSVVAVASVAAARTTPL